MPKVKESWHKKSRIPCLLCQMLMRIGITKGIIFDFYAKGEGSCPATWARPPSAFCRASYGPPRCKRFPAGAFGYRSDSNPIVPKRKKAAFSGCLLRLHGGGFEPSTSTTSRWHSPAELAVHCITIMHDLKKLSSTLSRKFSRLAFSYLS